jgi:hypothetical protein
MADAKPDIVDVSARAALHAQTHSKIGWNIPVFLWIKPYTLSAEQWVQRVDNDIGTGGWKNAQTIGFVTTALQDSALKWYDEIF